ncbi:somatotropin-like [Mixophyes fleayi]|uniref:somatotropin-like n=1 Tax=Mixophyes fleayi TaxID=3061075 RepID=UPI003F4E2D8A
MVEIGPSPHTQEDLQACNLHPLHRKLQKRSKVYNCELPLFPGLFSSLGLLVIVCLQSPPGFSAFPQISLSNLFTNAVFRAQYLHQMIADACRDYERTYFPEDQRNSNKNSYPPFCYSETIPAPTDKDNTHQKSDMDLLRFSLTLIRSWMTPMRMLANNQVFRSSDRVCDKLGDLEEGLYALITELDGGNARNYGVPTFPYDKFAVNLRNEDSRIKNFSLLSCLKKDIHKVETYLNVIKCRRFVESNCTF